MNTSKAQILHADYDNIRTQGAAIYQMAPCTPSQMMGYAIRTEGGKLYLVDGGTRGDMQGFLTLARRVSGTPDDAVLHIDGWFLTHIHSDHVDACFEAFRTVGDTFAVEKLYCNFPSEPYVDQYEHHEVHTVREYLALREAGAFDGIEVPLHKGDHFDFGDVVFDILTEPDESITVNVINNTSVAIRMTLCGQRVLFLGDMGVEEGNAMVAAYDPAELACDFVEAAHHGQNGVDYPVYFVLKPKAVLWCTPDWLWTNNAGGGYGTGPWKTFHVRCCMQDLGVKHHFIEKDGIWEIPMPYEFG